MTRSWSLSLAFLNAERSASTQGQFKLYPLAAHARVELVEGFAMLLGALLIDGEREQTQRPLHQPSGPPSRAALQWLIRSGAPGRIS